MSYRFFIGLTFAAFAAVVIAPLALPFFSLDFRAVEAVPWPTSPEAYQLSVEIALALAVTTVAGISFAAVYSFWKRLQDRSSEPIPWPA